MLHELEVHLAAEDVVKLLGLAGGEGGAFGGDEVGEGGGRGGVDLAAVEEGVEDGEAVGAHGFLAEAESVAEAAVDLDLALGGQGFTQVEGLFFQGVLGLDHGEAEGGIAHDGDRVAGFEVGDEGLEALQGAFGEDEVVVVGDGFHAADCRSGKLTSDKVAVNRR